MKKKTIYTLIILAIVILAAYLTIEPMNDSRTVELSQKEIEEFMVYAREDLDRQQLLSMAVSGETERKMIGEHEYVGYYPQDFEGLFPRSAQIKETADFSGTVFSIAYIADDGRHIHLDYADSGISAVVVVDYDEDFAVQISQQLNIKMINFINGESE